MRKLIRSKATKAFLTKRGQWTNQIQKAAEFPDQAQAHAAVLKFHLLDVESYYSFSKSGLSRYDFAVALG